MKIGVLYFSGTGNTASAINAVKQELTNNGHVVEMKKMEEGWFINRNKFDLLIFATPKHFEYIPLFFLNWLRENILKEEKTIDAAVLLTGGAGMCTGFKKIINVLKEKNINVKMTKTIKMASNYTFASKKELDTEKAIQDCKAGEEDAKKFANDIHNKKYTLEPSNFLMEKLCDNISVSFGKKTSKKAKDYSISKDCNKCGMCIKNCPTENINIINGNIEFGDSCISCLRCINICNKNAILIKGNVVKQYRINIDKAIKEQNRRRP